MSPFAKTFDAGAELIEDVLRRRGKPDWEIRDCKIDGETWPVTIEPAVRSPFGDLLHFRRAGAEIAPKVLIVVFNAWSARDLRVRYLRHAAGP